MTASSAATPLPAAATAAAGEEGEAGCRRACDPWSVGNAGRKECGSVEHVQDILPACGLERKFNVEVDTPLCVGGDQDRASASAR